MLKFIIALFLTVLLAVVHCNSNAVNYVDRPELVEDGFVFGLARKASKWLAKHEELILDHIKITHVQTKTVNGVRYKLDFTAQSIIGNQSQLVNCKATVYMRVGMGASLSVVDAQCKPK